MRGLLCVWLGLLLVVGSIPATADYDELVARAITYRNAGDLSSAESLLREADTLVVDRRESIYLLGMVLAFQQNFTESERLLDEGLQLYPEDINLRLARARLAAYQGEFAQAEIRIDAVLAEVPRQIDARLMAARISLYRGQYQMGKQRFAAVLEDEPQNLEALIGLSDAERYLGNEVLAEVWLQQALIVSPNHTDVRDRMARRYAPALLRHELTAGFEHSRFGRPVPDWYDRFVEYRHLSANGDQQYLRLEHNHHFDLHGDLIEAGVSWLNRSSTPVQFSVATSSGADFLPDYRLAVAIQFPVWAGSGNFGMTRGELALRESSYQTGNVTQVNLTLEHYFKNHDSWLTPGIGWTNDEQGAVTVSMRMGFHHQLDSRWRIGADFSDAPETINAQTRDTFTWHVYTRYRLGHQGYVRIDWARHRRETAFGIDYRYTSGIVIGTRF